ncbi:MAG: hypothetical protein MUE63_04665, partial [Xanthomonadales bacterium]|nr:hypothetical protein [Xanthomonadales bacterium]
MPASIGLALLLGMLASACDSGRQSEPSAPAASRTPVAVAPADDCSTQADRETFIEKQIAQGYWQKVGRVARLFHVHVTPAFLADLSPDEQQQALALLSA